MKTWSDEWWRLLLAAEDRDEALAAFDQMTYEEFVSYFGGEG